ncbi:hypothetical protein ZHAS_00014100 [Anopheles sinensis]|uniref:Uncharacterized protein n=1 Tax=Anopheles sinensis TaxID=74873 RepID=A0A084W767_ANOSI|nr:hypothetical protein ZHAS_00014100 [Anopheles sinensis]
MNLYRIVSSISPVSECRMKSELEGSKRNADCVYCSGNREHKGWLGRGGESAIFIHLIVANGNLHPMDLTNDGKHHRPESMAKWEDERCLCDASELAKCVRMVGQGGECWE